MTLLSTFAIAALLPALAIGLAATAPPLSGSTMRTMTSSRTTAETKATILSDLQALRQVEGAFEAKLDELVAEVEATPSFAKRRWPLVSRLPSRRIRNGAVCRLLETTLSSDDSAKQGDDARFKRSALLVILRQLAEEDTKDVRALEREVTKTRGRQPSMVDMLSFTPDLETPKYEVVDAVSGASNDLKLSWEVRQYVDHFSVVSSEMGNGAASGAGSFQSLAGYIFGKNKEETKMAMTTPVISSTTSEGKKMSFVMPRAFSDAAPTPMDDAKIAVEGSRFEESPMAALWFSGFVTDALLEKKKGELRALVAASETWELATPATDIGAEEAPAMAQVLQYNDPFTAPWKRRNEVAYAVTAAKR